MKTLIYISPLLTAKNILTDIKRREGCINCNKRGVYKLYNRAGEELNTCANCYKQVLQRVQQ